MCMNLLVDGGRRPKALLVLEDGTTFVGRSCGAEGEAEGPIAIEADIFGYQRALGSAENDGAIVALTYPQVGNFGINADAPGRVSAVGLVVHDMVYTPSSWQCEQSLPDYLAEQGVVGIEDVDVRALVAHLREHPGMRGAISTLTLEAADLLARSFPERGGEANA